MVAADILGERARLTPGKIALVCVPSGARFTYAELDGRARACAGRWHALGLQKGDRVAILARSRPEYLDAFFAAGKSGIVLVPLNARQTAHELTLVIQDAGCRALMFDTSYSDTVHALRSSLQLEHWIDIDALNNSVIPSERAARVEEPCACSAPGTSPADKESFVIPSDRSVAEGIEGPAFQPLNPEDLYCLLYTSGTTGRPKGVMIPRRMVAWNAFNTVVSWQLRDTDISPIFTPLYHAGGLAVSLTATFLIGGTIVLHERFDAAEVLRTIEREHCTIVFGVPTIFKMLLDAPEFASTDLSSARWCISGGAPLPLYIIEAWQRRGIILKQGYGLTEVGVNCFAMTPEDSARKPGSIGKPMMFTEARVVAPPDSAAPEFAGPTHGFVAPPSPAAGPADATTAYGANKSSVIPSERAVAGARVEGPCVSAFRDCSPDEVGELWLRGPHVCRGYWNNREATAAALDPDGWFHTGDLARCDKDGFYYIAGRLKDMIISGGVNIYPAEIEAELLQHPAIRDAAVIGVPHETWGEVGVAYIVALSAVTSEELAGFLAARLGRYKIPKQFIYINELPRTAYGKVLKAELRARWEKERSSATSSSKL